MKQVPVMLSTKDLMYIEDILNVTITIAKKVHEYEKIVKTPNVKKEMKAISDMLSKNYNSLLEVLNNG